MWIFYKLPPKEAQVMKNANRVPVAWKDVFAVGFFTPKGKFYCVLVYQDSPNAESAVHYLNGGMHDFKTDQIINQMGNIVERIEKK
jgi:hypothetical protein